MAFTVTEGMDSGVKARVLVEARIARCLVSELLEQGFVLSVNDGEEVTVKRSNSADEVMEALATTDSDVLIAESISVRGWFCLVYGNDGWDVISDNTSNMEQFIPKTNALVEELG